MQANKKRPPSLYREVHTITSEEILDKRFALEKIPKLKELTQYLPDGGILQRFGIDYTIVEGILSWESLGLEEFEFIVGDIVMLTYFV